MIERPLSLVLLAAPFLYLGGLVLSGFPSTDLAVALAPTVCLIAAALLAWPRESGWRVVGGGMFLALVGLTLAAFALPGSGTLGGTLAAGLFVGVPAIALALAWRTGEPLGGRVVAYGFSLTWGVVLLAARDALVASSTAITGPSFSTAFYQVNANQVSGLAGLLDRSGYTSLPLHAAFDPAYTALVALSLLGLLLVLARPQTGMEVPLPVSPRLSREGAEGSELAEAYGFSAAQRAVFRERSAGIPALTMWPPGLPSVVCAAAAAGATLLLSILVPDYALVSSVGALGVVAVAVVVLAEVPRSVLRPGGRPRRARVPPVPPSAPEFGGTGSSGGASPPTAP
jgi:hypothetical protein